MSFKNQALRDLVVERLAVAADEIFALFERTFAEYEEEFLRSKLQKSPQEPRTELTVIQSPSEPADVHLSPEPIVEKQKSLVKKEEEPSLELPASAVLVKSEENLDKCTFLEQEEVEEQRQEPEVEQENGAEPGCSSDLHSDSNKQSYSCSDTDDSDDWERATKSRTKSDEKDPDLVLIEDSNSGRDDENAFLSFANFPGGANAMLDQGLFNLPVSPEMNTSEKAVFRCSVCFRDFERKAQLRSHMQTHAAQPLRCSVCGKEFSQRAHLKRHMQTHSAEKFSCPECGLRLKQQHNMHRHISAVHRREKPHSCLFCQKAFAQKSDFIIHMRTHTGEKPFVCAFCRKGFRVRASLNKHIQKTHAGV